MDLLDAIAQKSAHMRWRLALAVTALVLFALGISAVLLGFRPGYAVLLIQPTYYDQLPVPSPDSAEYVLVSKWDRSTLIYSIRNCPQSLDCETAKQSVREALEAWDRVSGLTLTEVSGDADINVLWATRFHGDGNPFDGPGRILAHAFFPLPELGALAGDIHLDDDEVWVVSQPNLPWHVHLTTSVMHEAGHALGINHTNDPSALMWAQYEGVRGLGADDIAAIQALYGPPTADEVGPGSDVPAAPTGLTATANTVLRMRSLPSTAGSQLASIPNGTVLPILGKNSGGDWLYIDYQGGRGWIAGWYTTINGSLAAVPVVPDNGTTVPPPPADPEQPAAPSSVSATPQSNARMRSGPGIDFSQISTIPASTSVPVLGRSADSQWLYVEYNGQKGWVAAWLCTITGALNSVPVTG